MVFDGSKQSCPNYSGGDLDLSWDAYSDHKTEYDELSHKKKKEYNKTCFDICGPGHYVKEGECRQCRGDINGASDEQEDYRVNSPNYEMCYNDADTGNFICNEYSLEDPSVCAHREPVWFVRQKEGNLGRRQGRMDAIDWSDPSVHKFWTESNERVTDQNILEIIGERIPGSMEYKLPDEFITNGSNDFNKLRRKINEGRGDIARCDPTKFGGLGEDSKCYDKATDTYPINTVGTYGPEQLVLEEVHDFWVTEYGGVEDKDSDISGLLDFSNLLSGLQSDSAFEQCVNDSLNTPGSDDFEIQKRISNYTSIKEFSSKDIHYLKGKLRKIITMKTNQINECMNLLNLGKSICATGVADKTLMIGSLIFKIIGNDKIDIMKADNDERYKLNKLVDELGPLIPRAVKNIIHISKEYETRVCNVPSNTTLLLERLYTDLYDKQTHVTLDISPYIDFESLTETNNFWHFIQKIIVIIVAAVLLFAGANFAMVFLSRATVITRVNEG